MVIGIILAIISGIAIVMNRTMNERLSTYIGLKGSTLYNYITGIITASIVFLIMDRSFSWDVPELSFSSVIIYTGGAIGVFAMLGNIYVAGKVSAYIATLLMFSSQILTGILIDYFLIDEFSPGKLVGSIIIFAGLLLSLDSKKKSDEPEAANKPEDANKPDMHVN